MTKTSLKLYLLSLLGGVSTVGFYLVLNIVIWQVSYLLIKANLANNQPYSLDVLRYALNFLLDHIFFLLIIINLFALAFYQIDFAKFSVKNTLLIFPLTFCLAMVLLVINLVMGYGVYSSVVWLNIFNTRLLSIIGFIQVLVYIVLIVIIGYGLIRYALKLIKQPIVAEKSCSNNKVGLAISFTLLVMSSLGNLFIDRGQLFYFMLSSLASESIINDIGNILTIMLVMIVSTVCMYIWVSNELTISKQPIVINNIIKAAIISFIGCAIATLVILILIDVTTSKGTMHFIIANNAWLGLLLYGTTLLIAWYITARAQQSWFKIFIGILLVGVWFVCWRIINIEIGALIGIILCGLAMYLGVIYTSIVFTGFWLFKSKANNLHNKPADEFR